MSSSSHNNCNSRSWFMKSCFPDPPPPPPPVLFHHPTTTVSSLPDDILLDVLSRMSQPCLPSVSLVSRRWSELIDSSEFHQLRQRRGLLKLSVFVVSFSDYGLFAGSYDLGCNNQWRTTSLLVSNGFNGGLTSHARLAAIGRWVYVIGKMSMLRCDTWTGKMIPRAKMSVLRKKFAVGVVAGKVYVAGGSTRTTTVEEYDPERNLWKNVSHAPRMRYGCIGAAVDGVFYVIGGLKIGNDCTRATNASSRGGSNAHVYASSMDLYDVVARRWLRSRTIPGGGCVVAACASGTHIYILASHAVELSFWKFNGSRGVGFGEWHRLKSPPLPTQVRLDGTVRFTCIGVEEKVVLIQIMGCIDDLLRRSGRSTRGVKEALVLVYDSGNGEWSRGADLPDVIQRAAAVCVEW